MTAHEAFAPEKNSPNARGDAAIVSDLHELKLLLQDHFRDGLVTVVGSGLSCAEGLPGMTELAEHLRTVVGSGLSSADELFGPRSHRSLKQRVWKQPCSRWPPRLHLKQ